VLKRFAGRSLVYFLGALVNRSLTLLLLPVLTRYLSPADYGILAVCNSLGVVIGLVATLSLESVIQWFYYRLGTEQFRRFLATLWVFLLVVPLGLIPIGIVLGRWLGAWLFPAIPWFPYIQMTFGIAYLGTTPSVALTLLQVQQRAFSYVLMSMAGCVATAGGVLTFLMLGGDEALGGLKGQLAGALVMAAVANALLFRYCRPWTLDELDWLDLARALRLSLPYLPYSLFMWLLNVSDRWILARWVPLEELGLYSLAYALGMVMITLGSSLSMAFGPIYFERAEESNFRRQLPRLASVYALIPSWAALGLALFAPEFLRIMTRASYHGAARLVPWIVLAYWLHVAVYQLQLLVIEYHKQTRWILWLTGPAALVNIALNLVFVPRFGTLAAAFSTVAGFAIASIAARWLATRLDPIPYPWAAMAAMVAVAVAAYCVGNIYGMRASLFDSILTKGVIMVGAGALMLLLTGCSPARAWCRLKAARRAGPAY
jgi:O-antigen/teichoic acid export membrane protein